MSAPIYSVRDGVIPAIVPSAPITEAHRKLACDVLLDGVISAAQWIADSEARAVEAADFALQQERNIHMTTIAERDQLRAAVERLGRATTNGQLNWMQESDRQNARAERAEAELAAEQARLDWLRDNVEEIYSKDQHGIVYLSGDNIRTAIDAAMKEGK